jgi:uncharacterized protein
MKRFFGILIIVLLGGCISSHYDRTENFQFLWKIGDLDRAEEEAARLSRTGPKRDRLLYFLEEGSVARMNGDTKQSLFALNQAAGEYDRWFGSHLRTKTRISEEFLSTLGSAESKPYKSRIYERAMLRTYQAHNYLLMGDSGRARAEIFKTRQAIEDAKDIWSKELSVACEESKKKQVDISKTLNAKSSSSALREEKEKIKSLIPSEFPKFINPAALYFESLYFLHGASQREDFAKAEYSLRILSSIYPQNKWIEEDYRAAKVGTRPTEKTVYVFFETGRAPVRVEKRLDLPLFFFSATSRVPYLGIAFPSLRLNDQFLQDLEVFPTTDQSKAVTTKLLADMDAIVAQEFDEYFDIELSKAITGAISKGGLQHLVTNAIRSEDDPERVAVGAGVGMLAQATTRADLRSWSTLPKQVRFCKISTPQDRKLTLGGVGTNLSTIVNLKNKQTQLVWVRSISAFTPLRVVGVCSLSQN